MPTANQIKSLLQSHTTGDDERFYAVALQVAAAEARKGHQKLAEELRDLRQVLTTPTRWGCAKRECSQFCGPYRRSS